MIVGMSTPTYTLLHVIISLVGIGSGLAVLYGFLTARLLGGMTSLFLIATVLTSVSAFGFPFDHLLPSHKVGILSLVILTVAIVALYVFHLAGVWRRVFVVSALMALYLNCFVLVVQLFLKVSALKALAPTQKEPPFAVAQLIVLALFVGLTILSAKRFSIQTAH